MQFLQPLINCSIHDKDIEVMLVVTNLQTYRKMLYRLPHPEIKLSIHPSISPLISLISNNACQNDLKQTKTDQDWSSAHNQLIISPSSAHHQLIISSSSTHHQLIIYSSSAHHQFIISSASAHHYFLISSSSAHHQLTISSSSVNHQLIISSSSAHQQLITINLFYFLMIK